jgi:septum formation protein
MSAFTDETRVTFKELTDSEIEDYVAAGESMDKAGAYGLQGKAKSFVERIDGSKSNVIGLPVEKLEEALKQVR